MTLKPNDAPAPTTIYYQKDEPVRCDIPTTTANYLLTILINSDVGIVRVRAREIPSENALTHFQYDVFLHVKLSFFISDFFSSFSSIRSIDSYILNIVEHLSQFVGSFGAKTSIFKFFNEKIFVILNQ